MIIIKKYFPAFMVNISIRINGDLSPNQKRDAGLVFVHRHLFLISQMHFTNSGLFFDFI